MNKADRDFYISIGVIAVVLIGGYSALTVYTGFTAPFSVIMSESMQHSNTESQLGVIDTGDVVITQDPDKATIYSYVEGTQNGYRTFGDFGSVIIYERGSNHNPVIHRAIVWLEYNDTTQTWSAPSLEGYTGPWYFEDEENNKHHTWNNIHGTLVFDDITFSGKNNISINLDKLPKSSGYLTMGDNPEENSYFDQSVNIVDHLISEEDIKSVPIFEIPWLGTLKILLNGGDHLDHVTNSIPSLVMSFVTIIGLLITIDGISLYKNEKGLKNKISTLKQYKR